MTETTILSPAILTVAPNGARKTKTDHPMLPITPEELADEAAACVEQGAAMIHLHVRDAADKHTLDVGRYRDAIAAIRERCGDRIVIQVTSEAVGIYRPDQQMDMVRELKPEAVSLAIREIAPEGEEATAKAFLEEAKTEGVLPQFILYSAEDLIRFQNLSDEGVIPFDNPFLLFVLGRYAANQQSHPAELMPFLDVMEAGRHWAVCAFGPLENATAACALSLGGHVRVGFENNILLKNGTAAPRNADLVAQARTVAEAIGRTVATADDLRRL